jgi:hypothetical protein
VDKSVPQVFKELRILEVLFQGINFQEFISVAGKIAATDRSDSLCKECLFWGGAHCLYALRGAFEHVSVSDEGPKKS